MLTEAQKQARLGRITSSVAAACLGVDEFMSPIEAWQRIRGEHVEDHDEGMQKACERGNALESQVIEWGRQFLAERLGRRVFIVPASFRTMGDVFGDSADAAYAWQDDEGGGVTATVEAKTVAMGGADKYGEEMTDQIPLHALVQSHNHLMHWPEASCCYVPVLIGGHRFEFRMYKVERNEKFERNMQKLLLKWHAEFIVGDKQPPVTWRDADYLIRKYATGRDEAVLPATEKIKTLAMHKAGLALQIKELQKDEEQCKNELRDLLGDHGQAVGDWGTVTWRHTKGRIGYTAIAKALLSRCDAKEAAELVDAHTSEGHRVLRVHIKKER